MLTNRILLLLLYEEEQWIQILKYALTIVNHQQVYLTLIIQITHQSSDISMTGREDLLKITLNVLFFFLTYFSLGVSMEDAFHWTVSRIAASVTRVTEVPCVTRRESSSTPAVVCRASTAAVRSQTLEMPFVTVRVAILGNSVTLVGLH